MRNIFIGARNLIVRGWVEPLSLTANGHISTEQHHVARWCLFDALEYAAGYHPEASVDAWESLRALLPYGAYDVQGWLEDKKRTVADVVKLLNRAAQKAGR